MKKIKVLLMALLLTLGLTACGENPDDKGEPKADSYYHEFSSNEFKKEGGKTADINGLSWSYGSMGYLGSSKDKGVQIGSSNYPADVSFEASFPSEVTLTDYEIVLGLAKNGKATAKVDFTGSTADNETTFETETVTLSADNLEAKTNYLKLSLKAEKGAMYLKSIGFTAIHAGSWDLKADNKGAIEDEDIPSGSIKPGENGVAATKFKLVSIEEYYKNTDLTKTKNALRSELNELVSTMTAVSYGDARNMLPYIDEDIQTPGKINGIYDAKLLGPAWDQGHTWNREHVWACNHMRIAEGDYRPNNGTKNHTSDLHNLRACSSSINSSRGDSAFGEGGSLYFPNQNDEGVDYRGDVARILFYMYVRYTKLNLGESANNTTMGKLSVLIEWANEDKPDAFEKRRNNRIYEYQGNRNPFIDHPELVNQLFA